MQVPLRLAAAQQPVAVPPAFGAAQLTQLVFGVAGLPGFPPSLVSAPP